jgi:hypothetical protein
LPSCRKTRRLRRTATPGRCGSFNPRREPSQANTSDPLEAALEAVADTAEQVADGGDAYGAGIRDLAPHLALASTGYAGTLRAIRQRSGN